MTAEKKMADLCHMVSAGKILRKGTAPGILTWSSAEVLGWPDATRTHRGDKICCYRRDKAVSYLTEYTPLVGPWVS